MCHPKYRPLNGLPSQIGNPAGTASRDGNCPSLQQAPAAISIGKAARDIFSRFPTVLAKSAVSHFCHSTTHQYVTRPSPPPAPASSTAPGKG